MRKKVLYASDINKSTAKSGFHYQDQHILREEINNQHVFKVVPFTFRRDIINEEFPGFTLDSKTDSMLKIAESEICLDMERGFTFPDAVLDSAPFTPEREKPVYGFEEVGFSLAVSSRNKIGPF